MTNTPTCNPTGTTTSCAFLHQFTGVFNGTPAESSTNGWPVVVASAPLAGPVYTSGTAYVSDDYDGHGNGPRLHSVDTTVSPVTVAASVQLGPTSGATVLPVDAVIVDASAGREYEFIGNDSPTNSAAGHGASLPVYHRCDGCSRGDYSGSRIDHRCACLFRRFRQHLFHLSKWGVADRKSLRVRQFRRRSNSLPGTNHCQYDGGDFCGRGGCRRHQRDPMLAGDRDL